MAHVLQVRKFCRQYLQLEPILDYPDNSLLRREDVQETIYQALFQAGRAAPAPTRYQVKTLKALLGKIEQAIDDWETYGISDNLASASATVLAMPASSAWDEVRQKCNVAYHLSLLEPAADIDQSAMRLGPCITLLESRHLISAGGTTGLRTWEAALHLGQYLCLNRSLVAGKRVLELGAGTGYLSVLCAAHLGAAHVVASDGSADVVDTLPDTFLLNGLQTATETAGPRIAATELEWGHALAGTDHAAWNGGRTVDLVLGADLAYDKRVMAALVGTIAELMHMFPSARVLMAATERNRETFEAFEATCQAAGLSAESVDFPVPTRLHQTGPFYTDRVPIHITSLTTLPRTPSGLSGFG